MENLSIAIVSGDNNYAKALSMSLLSVCDRLMIKIFDSRGFVREWSHYKGEEPYCSGFDIILWAGTEISDAYGDNIIYLAEKPSMIRRDFAQKKFCLYKYSGAQSLIASIFEIYSFLTGRKAAVVYKRDVSLIAFASCRGGCGCSTVARAVAQEMSRFNDKSVIYVSMEEIESTGDFMKFPAGLRSTGEYLYRLFRECGGNLPFLESYVAKDFYGIESFLPTNGRNPLRNLNRKEIQKFLISLMDSGRYNLVVVDLGSCITEAGLAALELAGRLCFVASGNNDGHREEQYFSQLVASCDKKILDNAVRVTNYKSRKRCQAEEGRDDEFNPACTFITRRMRLRPIIRSATDSNGGITLEDEFGEDIRKLANHLMEIVD